MFPRAYIDALKARLAAPKSRNAFKCHKCPKEGCPAWDELVINDPVDGETVLKGCGFTLLSTRLNAAMGFAHTASEASQNAAQRIEGAVQFAVEAKRQLEAGRELKVLKG